MSTNRNRLESLLLVKVETTDGVDATPVVATDYMGVLEAFDAQADFAFRTARNHPVVGAAIQPLPPLKPKGRVYTAKSTIHVRGNKTGATYNSVGPVVPELDPWLQAAGLAGTFATSQWTYKPAATGLKSVTEYKYTDGKLQKAVGVKADVTLTLAVGGPLVAEVSRTGLYSGTSDSALPSLASAAGTSVAAPGDQVTLAIGSYSIGIVRSAKIALGNQIRQRGNLNATGALAPFVIRERQPTWEVVLEDPTISEADFEGLAVAQTGQALSFAVGATAFVDKCQVTLANARIDKVQLSDDQGTQLVTLSGGYYDSIPGANDALALLFS